MRTRFGSFAIAAAVIFGVAACGGGEKVGEQFEEFEGEDGGARLGEVERTPKSTAAAAAPKATPGAAAPARTKAPAAQAPSTTVRITSEGFDPTVVRVAQGSTIEVTNTHTAPHSYTSSDNVTYDTGLLQPGATKTFVASKAGRFQMEDRSRNWIIGELEVFGG